MGHSRQILESFAQEMKHNEWKRLGLTDLLFSWVIICRAFSFLFVAEVLLEDGKSEIFDLTMETEDLRLKVLWVKFCGVFEILSEFESLTLKWVREFETFELISLCFENGSYTQ